MSGELCSSACSFCGRCDADDDTGPYSVIVCQICGDQFTLPPDEQGKLCDACLDQRRLRVNDAIYVAAVRSWFRRTDPAA